MTASISTSTYSAAVAVVVVVIPVRGITVTQWYRSDVRLESALFLLSPIHLQFRLLSRSLSSLILHQLLQIRRSPQDLGNRINDGGKGNRGEKGLLFLSAPAFARFGVFCRQADRAGVDGFVEYSRSFLGEDVLGFSDFRFIPGQSLRKRCHRVRQTFRVITIRVEPFFSFDTSDREIRKKWRRDPCDICVKYDKRFVEDEFSSS
jgi:hypothetical protein